MEFRHRFYFHYFSLKNDNDNDNDNAQFGCHRKCWTLTEQSQICRQNIVKRNLCLTIFCLYICDSIQHNGDVPPEIDTEQNSTRLKNVNVRSRLLNFVSF